MAGRSRHQSSLTPPQHPPKPPDRDTTFWKLILRLAFFVIIHQIINRN
jgi:hypothetical protein